MFNKWESVAAIEKKAYPSILFSFFNTIEEFPASREDLKLFKLHGYSLVSFSIFINDLSGQVFTLFILTVAAAEAAIGLAIIVVYYRNRGSIRVEDIHGMKG